MTEIKGYEEITRTEYKNLKKSDPHNCDGYTARVGFHYFKKKEDKIIKDEYSDLSATILDNGWVALHQEDGSFISLGNYPNAKFRIIERLMEELKHAV